MKSALTQMGTGILRGTRHAVGRAGSHTEPVARPLWGNPCCYHTGKQWAEAECEQLRVYIHGQMCTAERVQSQMWDDKGVQT